MWFEKLSAMACSNRNVVMPSYRQHIRWLRSMCWCKHQLPAKRPRFTTATALAGNPFINVQSFVEWFKKGLSCLLPQLCAQRQMGMVHHCIECFLISFDAIKLIYRAKRARNYVCKPLQKQSFEFAVKFHQDLQNQNANM